MKTEPSTKGQVEDTSRARGLRAPYEAPRLRWLGSVREITQGSGSQAVDTGGTMKQGL